MFANFRFLLSRVAATSSGLLLSLGLAALSWLLPGWLLGDAAAGFLRCLLPVGGLGDAGVGDAAAFLGFLLAGGMLGDEAGCLDPLLDWLLGDAAASLFFLEGLPVLRGRYMACIVSWKNDLGMIGDSMAMYLMTFV